MTATIDDTRTHAEDAYQPEEETNVDAKLRRQMGLRPLYYHEVGKHPDRRRCPSWCWVGQTHGEYEHEVDARHLLAARHEMNSTPAVAATLNQGEFANTEYGNRHARMASIELRLEQLRQAAPTIRVALRQWKGRKQRHQERLKLTVDDARQLMAALGYLIETADTGA